MSWRTKGGWTGFITGALSPDFYPSLFRPLGHLHYYVVEKLAGLHFPAFVAANDAYHLLASWVLWQVLRPGLPDQPPPLDGPAMDRQPELLLPGLSIQRNGHHAAGGAGALRTATG